MFCPRQWAHAVDAPERDQKPTARVHLLCFAIVVAGGLTFFAGGEGGVASALGRQSNLSGRTLIWGAVVGAAGTRLLVLDSKVSGLVLTSWNFSAPSQTWAGGTPSASTKRMMAT